jgi:hypothetical protein
MTGLSLPAIVPRSKLRNPGQRKNAMNKYWTLVLPVALIGVIYYGYSSPGFVGRKIQTVVNPLLDLGHAIVGFVFGI